LYTVSQRTIEDSARFALYQEMNEIIKEEAPVIILYYDQVIRLISKKVEGLGINPLNMLDLRRVRIEQDQELN
jgi:peptide/nickel transport system substrate-binding protein